MKPVNMPMPKQGYCMRYRRCGHIQTEVKGKRKQLSTILQTSKRKWQGIRCKQEDGEEESVEQSRLATIVEKMKRLQKDEEFYLDKMRDLSQQLNQELAREEAMKQIEALKEIEDEVEEISEIIEYMGGFSPAERKYVEGTFITVGFAFAAWLIGTTIFGEDTSWWWSWPTTLSGLKFWIGISLPPLLVAGIVQLKLLKPVLKSFPYLEEYIQHLGSQHDIDTSTKNEVEDESNRILTFLSYICFDSASLGSEVTIVFGFFQGLLFQYLGAFGWAADSDIQYSATSSMGSLVNASLVNSFSIGPLCVIFLALLVNYLDNDARDTFKSEPEILSEFVYDDFSDQADLEEELKPLVAYLSEIRIRKRNEKKKERTDLVSKLAPASLPTPKLNRIKNPFKRSTEGELDQKNYKPFELGKKLYLWQTKLTARKKFMWIESLYWIYLGGEAYLTHSLVPSIITAISLEAFSWYKLWHKEEISARL